MKSAVVAGFLASVLYSQQAVATYGWNDAQQFSSPQNCNNQCSDQQSGGWSFDNVPSGNVGSFDGMTFSGFSCQDSFNAQSGKRGLHRRTQFSGKALVGKATNDDSSCPKFSSSQRGFSINEMQVSVDKDSELTFEYIMGDGSICQQKARCSTGGTTVKNTQCGGANQVRVKGDCNFGFHSIGFDCSPSQHPVTTPTRGTTTTAPVCKSTETLSGGSCVPTPPRTTPVTTAPTCAETETKNDKGSCVPKTPTGGITSPPATTAASTTSVVTTPATTACKESETPDKNGSCVPKTPTGGITSPPATTAASTTSVATTPATTACKESETPDKNGSCVPKTPTGGITTPITCASSMTLSSGSCVPPTTVVSPPTSCKNTETMSGTVCIPIIPTGGVTTPPATSEIVTTEIVVTTLTTCPVTVTSGSVTSVTQTISTTVITSTATFCPKCGEAPPTGGQTPTTPPAATSACSAGSTMDKGSCVPVTPTGGITTVTTPVAPPSTTNNAAPTCKDNEEVQGGKCVPKTPTGGSTAPVTSAGSTTVKSSPPANNTPVPEAPCPSVLPRCLSTWMQQAGSCSSNSDSKCFCPSKDFIASVQDCVSAWGGSDAEIQSALSFLAGICADFVPQNPGICTGVPSSITLIPTPSAPPAPSSPPTGGAQPPAPTAPPAKTPTTVITFTHTLTSGSVATQTVTVPQVAFNTIIQSVTASGPQGTVPSSTQGVGLVPAVPFTNPTGSGAGSSPTAATPVAGQTGTGLGASASKSGPVSTFIGGAGKTSFGVAAGMLGLIAFLA